MAAAPVVDGVGASPAVVAPGEVVSLQVDAHDPDCGGVCTSGCGMAVNSGFTTWSAPDGTFSNQDDGTTSSPYTGTVDWQAPATEGTYTITVEVADNDGGGLCFGTRSYATGTVDVLVTSVVTQPPVVGSFTADRGQMYPGERAGLLCSASDPDGEEVTYSWSSDRGTVTPGVGGEASFEGGDPGIATVTCTATDPNGASGSANVSISVSDAFPERQLTQGLRTPQRLALDGGKVYVVDPAAGGVAVLDLASGERTDFLALPGVTSVAVDWAGDLLVGSRDGARVLSPSGAELLELESGRGFVSDVAVDALRQRYAVLHRDSGRVAVYDASGSFHAGFGRSGTAATGFERPMGVAFTPEGRIVVADSGHGLVKVFTLAGELLQSFGGLGGGAGQFVQLGDVEVDGDGILYTTDGYQDWIQTWNPGGTPREALGTYGGDLGQLRTPVGVAVSPESRKLLVASLNGARVEVFALAPAGHVPAPEAVLSSGAVAFGNQTVATTLVRTLSLSNAGDAPLTLQSVVAGGDFAASHGCGAAIEAGSSCVLSVAFTPATTGPRDATMKVTTSDGVFDVALSGSGVLPATATLSGFALAFPRQVVGTTSVARTVTMTNYGGEALAVSGVQAGAHFGTLTTCGSLLPGGTSCSIDVYFTPAASGDPLTSTLLVYTSAGTQAVSLSGLAVALEVTPSPSAVDFGAVAAGSTSTPRTVTVTNTGDETLTFAQLGVAGAGAGEFSLTDDGCSQVLLPAGSSCAFQVTYSPAGEAPATAEVALVTGAPTTPVVTLAGTGAGAAIFADGFESGDTAAWSAAVGTQQIVLLGDLKTGESTVHVLSWRNQLARPVTVELLTYLGEGAENLTVDDGCSGAVLEPGARCEVKVTFAPWREGETFLRLVLPSHPPRALEPGDTVLYGEARVLERIEEK